MYSRITLLGTSSNGIPAGLLSPAVPPPGSGYGSNHAGMQPCMHACRAALRRVELCTFKAGDGWKFGLKAAIDAADGEQVRRVDGPQEKANQCLT